MARRNARKLYQEIVREAQSGGCSIHNDGSGRPLADRIGLTELQTFANISEACGVDRDGHALQECWGPETDMRLREGKYDPDREYTIPVRRRAQSGLEEYSIRDLYENLVVSRADGEPVGHRYVEDNMRQSDEGGRHRLYEAGTVGAVDSSLFYGITGQLLISAILQRFIQESFVVTNLCGRYPTKMVHGERIPGVGLLADPDKNNIESVTLLKEGEPIKFIGTQEEYIELPATEKHGLGVQVTRETVYEDRTGLVLEQAANVGNILGLRKEKRLIGAVIGGTTSPVYFKEKRAFDKTPMTLNMYQYEVRGSSAYQLNSTSTSWNSTYNYSRPYPWYNDVPNNPLHDFTAFRTADQYFSKVVDPNTGEPVEVGKPFVLLPYTRRWDLMQIVQAMNIFKMSQAAGQSGTFSNANLITQTPTSALNGLMAQQFASSRQLRAQMISQLGLADADVDWVWFNGDFSEAVRYMENWPLTVVQAPPQNEAEFLQDIVARFKATEKGIASIWNPRVIQRHNYQSAVSGA